MLFSNALILIYPVPGLITLRDVERSETCHHHRQTPKKAAITPTKQAIPASIPYWNTPTCVPAARKTHRPRLTSQPTAICIPKSPTPTMSSTYPMGIPPATYIQPPNRCMFTCTHPRKVETPRNCLQQCAIVIWKKRAKVAKKFERVVGFRRRSRMPTIGLKFRHCLRPCLQDRLLGHGLMGKERWAQEVTSREVSYLSYNNKTQPCCIFAFVRWRNNHMLGESINKYLLNQVNSLFFSRVHNSILFLLNNF